MTHMDKDYTSSQLINGRSTLVRFISLIHTVFQFDELGLRPELMGS